MIIKRVKLPEFHQKEKLVFFEGQEALILPVGDVHMGADGFIEEKFIKFLQWGVDRGAMFLGMGEYLDFTSKSQRDYIIPLRDSTKKQLDNMVKSQADEFYELAKITKGRWLGMLEGDHRWDFQDGTSVEQYLCSKLECDFLGTCAWLILVPPNGNGKHSESYTSLWAHHGIGSSRSIGGHFHRVEDVVKAFEADIYLMGHSHAKSMAMIDRQYLTPDGVHTHKEKLIARTGGFLRGYASTKPLSLDEPAFLSRGDYVEQRVYTPSSLGSISIGIGTQKIDKSLFWKPKIHCSF